MPLSVTTRHLAPFRRCGLEFGPNPTVVGDEQLKEVVNKPGPDKKKPFVPVTLREMLLAEPMLVCVSPAEVKAAAKKAD